MQDLSKLLSSEALDVHVFSGISLGFALIFFMPLFLAAAIFFIYCVFAKRSVIPAARFLSAAWLAACVPAALLILMGYAFNSSKMNPLLSVPLWVATGLAALWLPVALRRLFRITPT